jgi:hypothetical protein
MSLTWSARRRHTSWTAVLLAMKVAAMRWPRGGTLQTEDMQEFGIHSKKLAELRFTSFCTSSSTSRVLKRKRS